MADIEQPADMGPADGGGDAGAPPGGIPIAPMANLIAIPNIRNGALADITSAAPREYIPRSYRWSVVGGLPTAEMPAYVEVVCRAQFVTLCDGNYGAMDEPARVLARRKAIVMGSIRAAVAAAYQLVENDMQATEVTSSPRAVGGAVGARTLVDVPGSAVAAAAAWNGWVDATDAERTVMNALMYLGIGVPALQGFSLVRFGHHFLSTGGDAPKKPWVALVKQVRASVPEAVHTWMDYEWFQDVAFHKACHPISPATKQAWAKDPATKARLVTANLGSAAVRLPATPPDFEQAKAALSLLQKAKPSLEGMSITINLAGLLASADAVARADPGQPTRDAVAAAVHLVEAHAPRVAYAAGIVAKIHETGAPSSLLTAFSIRRLVRENQESYDAGFRAKAALNVRVAEQLTRGEFTPATWDM